MEIFTLISLLGLKSSSIILCIKSTYCLLLATHTSSVSGVLFETSESIKNDMKNRLTPIQALLKKFTFALGSFASLS